MTTIAPSLLACNFFNIENELNLLKAESNIWIHLDIMDGHFVPNLTFGASIIKNMSNKTSHKLDAHLMVSNPEHYVEVFKNLGLHNFCFHWEATNHPDRLVQHAKTIYPSVGIALNPGTDIKVIPLYILKKVDLILIMSVNPGFGGQSFIPGVIDKITYLKKIKNDHALNFEIQVDGGVTDKNARTLIDAGATNLVAGSFIFKEPSNDYSTRIKALRE